MKTYILTPLAVIAAITLVRLSFYTVDAAEYAYVTVLGQHRETFDGNDPVQGAGLKIGWPWPIQQIQRLDRRLQQFDLPAKDELTRDPDGNKIDKVLSIEAYVCWKINPQGVDQFVQRIGSNDNARGILGNLIVGKLGAAISERRMDDLVNTSIDLATGRSRVDLTLEQLRAKLLSEVRTQARNEYGIDLVDIRLRRFNHPSSVRDSIFARIRAERSNEAAKYISEGDLLKANILNEADAEIRTALAAARNKEEAIKAEADIEAAKIRDEAYSKDPAFYTFLKQMEKMQSIVGDQKTMLLLSTHRPLFEMLFTPPRPKVDETKKGGK